MLINRWIKIFIALCIVGLITFIAYNMELFSSLRSGDIESLESSLKENLGYTLMISLVAMIAQNTLTFIPIILLITINITVFGVFYGALWSWITSIVAAMVVFLGARYFFQDWVHKKVNIKALKQQPKNGFMYVLGARVFPFLPSSLINIISALSPIRFKHFIIATAIGNFIYFSVISLITMGIVSASINEYVLSLIVIAITMAYFLFKKIQKNRMLKEELITNQTDIHEQSLS